MAVRIQSFSRKHKKPSIVKLAGMWIIFPLLLILIFLSLGIWMAGKKLIHEDIFNHVEWAVILAGQTRDCERTDAAVKLFRQDKISFLLLSSTPFFKSRYSSDYIIPDLVKQDIPAKNIFDLRHRAFSTIEEASIVIKQLRLLGADTALIITSNFHSARAKSIFNSLSGGSPHFLVYPAEYDVYDPQAWWANRQSKKIFLLETVKKFFSFFEVRRKIRKDPVEGSAESLLIEPRQNLPDRYNPEKDYGLFDGEEDEKIDETIEEPALEPAETPTDTSAKSDKVKK